MGQKDPRDGHRTRLREKFIKFGLVKFTDEEVIELLLTLGTPRKDCKQIARSLFAEFGSFHQIMESSLQSLQKIKGVGSMNAFGIKLIHEVARKFLREKIFDDKPYLDNMEAIMEYYEHKMGYLPYESVHVIYLNARNKVLDELLLIEGSISSVMISSRVVLEKAMSMAASSIVLVHNHPSGEAVASVPDINFTHELFFACKLMGLELRDHLIITRDSWFSFLKSGMMSEFNVGFEKMFNLTA